MRGMQVIYERQHAVALPAHAGKSRVSETWDTHSKLKVEYGMNSRITFERDLFSLVWQPIFQKRSLKMPPT